jgi:hypothetical protein
LIAQHLADTRTTDRVVFRNNVFHCKDETYTALALTMAGLIFGLFLGEATVSLERASMMSAWFVTIAAFWFGIKIIWIGIQFRQGLLIMAVLASWLANVGFSLSLQPEPLVDMIFDVATFLSLIVMLRYAEDHIKNLGAKQYGRRAEDWHVCPSCEKPFQQHEKRNAAATSKETGSQAVSTDGGVQE